MWYEIPFSKSKDSLNCEDSTLRTVWFKMFLLQGILSVAIDWNGKLKYDIVRIKNKIKSCWYLYQKVANIYKENNNKSSILFAKETKCTNSFYHTPIVILIYSNHMSSDSTICYSIENTYLIHITKRIRMLVKYCNLEQLDITKSVITMSHFTYQVLSLSLN